MGSKKHYHHTAKERQVAFDYLKQGKTVREAAELCNVSMSTIKNWKRNHALRGNDYKKPTRVSYSKYSNELKCHVVQEYLNGRDATELASLFGILNPTSVTVWARDERFRGGITLNEESRPEKNNEKRKAMNLIKAMTPEEELQFLRMENAILKKVISLRTERRQQKKK